MWKRSLAAILTMIASIGLERAQEARKAPSAVDLLTARWSGAWVVTSTETFSDCVGAYTDNWVGGGMVSSRGRNRFEPGVPARVDSLDVSRTHLTLRLTLAEMLLVSRQVGEMTLRDEARCQVELKVGRPEGAYQTADLLSLESLLQPAAERYPSEADAMIASNFLPRDPQASSAQRLAALSEQQEWKTQQSSVALESRLDQWLNQTARLSNTISSDPDYLAGFARGVETGRASAVTQCAELMKVEPSMHSYRGGTGVPAAIAASKGSRQKAWSRGYEDGVRLSQGLEAIRVLPLCTGQPSRTAEAVRGR